MVPTVYLHWPSTREGLPFSSHNLTFCQNFPAQGKNILDVSIHGQRMPCEVITVAYSLRFPASVPESSRRQLNPLFVFGSLHGHQLATPLRRIFRRQYWAGLSVDWKKPRFSRRCCMNIIETAPIFCRWNVPLRSIFCTLTVHPLGDSSQPRNLTLKNLRIERKKTQNLR